MTARNSYFRKFPITTYRGVPSLNILKRVDFNTNVKNFYTAFYSFDIESGEKIETIAHDYYDDVDLDWLIYHANDIVDPYNDVPLNYNDLESKIKTKYGSIERAQKRTYLYRTNYDGDMTIIPVEGQFGYLALPAAKKKYWDPVYNNVSLVGYQRSREDIYATTNMIISFSNATPATTNFTVDEIVEFTSGSKSGSATVSFANSSYTVLKHIVGDWSTMTSNFDVVGDDSKATATFNYSTYKKIQDVIPAVEQVYFTKYSFYDFEQKLNDQKQQISLVDRNYADSLNEQLDKLMK